MKKHITLLFCFFLAGCQSIGPKQIDLDRSRYNDAIINTHNEQLLRNIVRLRYLKSVSFLKITSVTSSYTLTPGINGTFSLLDVTKGNSSTAAGTTRSAMIDPSLTYSDQPIISYIPVQGPDFIQRMLIPISLEYLALLLNGGVDDPRSLFNVAVSSINAYDNAAGASDLRVVAAPEYIKFRRLTHLFNELHEKKGARVYSALRDKKMLLTIRFSKQYVNSPEARELKTMLHIPLHYREIILSDKPLPERNTAVIRIRSMLSAMIFLSHGVQAPKEHTDAKLAPEYYIYPDKPYDWGPLMRGVFKVYSSKQLPSKAYVKIYMYGYWFYVAGDDVDSIQTFLYLDTMHVLTSGNAFAGENQAPVLTIPTRT